MEKVYTKNAPDAIGPYSQAVKVGNLVFTSGQIAINPATGNVDAEGIEAQTVLPMARQSCHLCRTPCGQEVLEVLGHRLPLRAVGKEDGQIGEIVIQDKPGCRSVPPPQRVAKSAVHAPEPVRLLRGNGS